TQPISLEQNRTLVELTLEAIQDIPDVRVVVKVHPGEPEGRLEVFQRLTERRGLSDRTFVTKGHEVYRLLAAADLVVNMMSNVGIEAALLGRNVVAVELDVETRHFSLDEIGLVDASRSRSEAVGQIRKLLLDDQASAAAESKRKAFFSANPELQDGKSIERLL